MGRPHHPDPDLAEPARVGQDAEEGEGVELQCGLDPDGLVEPLEQAPEHGVVVDRLKEVADGTFNAEMDKLTKMKQADLAELYNNRDMEPRD